MVGLLGSLLRTLRSVLRTRTDLALENLALRQQLAALRQQVRRPRVRFADRLFWAWLHRFWGRWREALILVQPKTVIRWHRRGFKRFWAWMSRRRGLGRPRIDRKLKELIERVATANPLWGAPRVRGMSIEEVLIAYRSPWQSPYVERLIGSIRRECLDHVIVLGEKHLRRILGDCFSYYHRSRTHFSLEKDSPERATVRDG